MTDSPIETYKYVVSSQWNSDKDKGYNENLFRPKHFFLHKNTNIVHHIIPNGPTVNNWKNSTKLLEIDPL